MGSSVKEQFSNVGFRAAASLAIKHETKLMFAALTPSSYSPPSPRNVTLSGYMLI